MYHELSVRASVAALWKAARSHSGQSGLNRSRWLVSPTFCTVTRRCEARAHCWIRVVQISAKGVVLADTDGYMFSAARHAMHSCVFDSDRSHTTQERNFFFGCQIEIRFVVKRLLVTNLQDYLVYMKAVTDWHHSILLIENVSTSAAYMIMSKVCRALAKQKAGRSGPS